MNTFSTRRRQALDACEKAINGIENGTISVSSSLLLCKRIARLVNDPEGQEWLDYEYGGYPMGDDNLVLPHAWSIGKKHGRIFQNKTTGGKSAEYMFLELCGELEAEIDSKKKAINNYTTQGYSVSGEWALVATSRMSADVAGSTNDLLKSIKLSERRLSILKSQYYDYAVKWQIELQFGSTANTVFEEYHSPLLC